MTLETTLARQKAAFVDAPPSDGKTREAKLKSLKRQIGRYQDVFADAVSEDFGNRPAFESRLVEVIGTIWVIDHAIKNARKWMRPNGRAPQLLFAGPNKLKVTYQPKGVVGIITPWNMPLYLSLGPLAASLAAGNRAMIKLPDETPKANAVIKTLLAEIFDEDEVAVFSSEIKDPATFTRLPFDHLIFTGSQRVGRIVMAAAAENLTPVTLELGGKSPAIVAPDYSLKDAARRIVHGKVALSGQICVAPDYAMLEAGNADAFAMAAVEAYNTFYPLGAVGRPEVCGLIDDRQKARLTALLEDARAKGAKISPAAEWDGGNQMPLHVVSGITEAMDIAQEEVFGPILPVLEYTSLEEAINYINARPHPLALYAFTGSAKTKTQILGQTRSGGATINDWGWHVVNAAVPFGGVGDSGFGTYHGIEGFRELSNLRPVFERHPTFPTQLFHPPVNKGFSGLFQNISMRFYAGKGDPSLGGTPYGPTSKEKLRT